MKTYSDYNEIDKKTPPVFPDYVVEAVLENSDNCTGEVCMDE